MRYIVYSTYTRMYNVLTATLTSEETVLPTYANLLYCIYNHAHEYEDP
jgi:hypothetical protein